MKKNTIILFAVISAIIISCTQNEDNDKKINVNNFLENSEERTEINKEIKVTSTTSLLSKMIINMGVKEIVVTRSQDNIFYKTNTEKSSIINGKSIDFSNMEFIYKNGYLYEKNNPNYSIRSIDNKLYLKTLENEDVVINFPNFEKNDYLVTLIIFYNEITLPNEVKTEFSRLPAVGSGGGCSFWNTVTVSGFGPTSAAALANLQYNVDTAQNNGDLDCRRLGGTESTGVFGLHISTNTYCCDGTGGGGGSW